MLRFRVDWISSESDGISRKDGHRSHTEAETTVEEAILHSVDALSSVVVSRRIWVLGESTGGTREAVRRANDEDIRAQ